VAPGATQAYAGYFLGAVGIPNAGDQKGLNIFANLSSPPETTGHLCLSGESPLTACRDYWDAEIIDPYWEKKYSNNFTHKLVYSKGVSHNIVLGDYVSSGKNTFMVDYDSGAMTIGDPGTYAPPGYTCGDGICNGTETYKTCRQDCPIAWKICNVIVTGITANSATIQWRTDCYPFQIEPYSMMTTGSVEYGPTNSYGNEQADSRGLRYDHKVILTDLTGDTKYYYRIRATDNHNQTVISLGYAFNTRGGAPDTENPVITILTPTEEQVFGPSAVSVTVTGYVTDNNSNIGPIMVSLHGPTGCSAVPRYLTVPSDREAYVWDPDLNKWVWRADWSITIDFYGCYGNYSIYAMAYDSSGRVTITLYPLDIFRQQCTDEPCNPVTQSCQCELFPKKSECLSNLCYQCIYNDDCQLIYGNSRKYCVRNNLWCVECQNNSDCTRLYGIEKPYCCPSGWCINNRKGAQCPGMDVHPNE